MEHTHPRTLASLLRQGPLDLETALRYAGEIGAALDSAHARGIVHGDVTPATVLITPSGAVLADRAGAPAGGTTPDARTDVYGFGATCYEMLTGRRPSALPPQPSQVNPAVPLTVDAVILRCLAEEPDERPRSIRAAVNALTIAMSEARAARASVPWRYAAAAAAMLAIVVAAGCPN
jgi:eukaryotic-like serine/threonine-protein kinase